jgi:hypothetical protein
MGVENLFNYKCFHALTSDHEPIASMWGDGQRTPSATNAPRVRTGHSALIEAL